MVSFSFVDPSSGKEFALDLSWFDNAARGDARVQMKRMAYEHVMKKGVFDDFFVKKVMKQTSVRVVLLRGCPMSADPASTPETIRQVFCRNKNSTPREVEIGFYAFDEKKPQELIMVSVTEGLEAVGIGKLLVTHYEETMWMTLGQTNPNVKVYVQALNHNESTGGVVNFYKKLNFEPEVLAGKTSMNGCFTDDQITINLAPDTTLMSKVLKDDLFRS